MTDWFSIKTNTIPITVTLDEAKRKVQENHWEQGVFKGNTSVSHLYRETIDV
jgi:hypothetical protein